MRLKSLFAGKSGVVWKLILLIVASILVGTLFYFGIVLWAFPAFSSDWGMLDGFTGVISLSLLVGGLVFAAIEYIGSEPREGRLSLIQRLR